MITTPREENEKREIALEVLKTIKRACPDKFQNIASILDILKYAENQLYETKLEL